jgi:Cof subfamily protein (haloacid dehalogenase superfamily)
LFGNELVLHIDFTKTLIITDIDGTFLPKSKVYVPRNMEAINRLFELGGHFSISTGRVLQAASHLIGDDRFVNFPVILGNGCMIYDAEKKKPLWFQNLDKAVFDCIKEIADNFPDVSVEINTPDEIIICRINDYERYHILAARFKKTLEMTLDAASHYEWVKVLFAGEPSVITKVVEYVSEKNWDCAEFVSSADIFFEILPKGCNKGTALTRMREILLPKEYTVIAMGDYYNDLEMLSAADFSACPFDSLREVKSAVDYVCRATCDEGAVGEVIEKLINGSLL